MTPSIPHSVQLKSTVCFISSTLKLQMLELMNNFTAGQVSEHLAAWEELTSDPEILQIVQGDIINFSSDPPERQVVRKCNVSQETETSMDKEITNMLQTRIIALTSHEEGEFLSPIFPVPKPEGKLRIILNLKKLNEYVEYHHFKMDNIKVVLANVTKGCFMTSLDLKQAYHSVRIHSDYRKYLKFEWNTSLYEFTCYPNGLGPCPRKFTKLMKAPLSYLRERGHLIIGYIDDFFLQGRNKEKCQHSLMEAIRLLQRLGFTIHVDKSQLDPSTRVVFLGFIIDSETMTVTLTLEKKEKLVILINKVLSKEMVKIRDVASLVGKFVSSAPASLYGPLHYRTVERDKNQALKRARGNYEANMSISDEAKHEICWWKDNIESMSAPIQWPPITQEVSTDASGKNGWGASMLGRIPIGGVWTGDQLDLHINVKEMMAILYALRAFVDVLQGQHVRVLCDNTTAVFTLNKMGTTKSVECNDMVKEIWQFCREQDMFITCTYIPGKENVVADRASRREYKQGEWMLSKDIFLTAVNHFDFDVNLDCFATRANAQIPAYVSRDPDPFATQIDAFSFNWNSYNAYLFPPFSLINRVIQKIRVDQAIALCVFPRWTTQAWWPQLQDMMVGEPIRMPPSPKNLVLPNKPEETHPLHRKLELIICMLSGKSTG